MSYKKSVKMIQRSPVRILPEFQALGTWSTSTLRLGLRRIPRTCNPSQLLIVAYEFYFHYKYIECLISDSFVHLTATTRLHIRLLRDDVRKELSKSISSESEYRKILFQVGLGVRYNFVPNLKPDSHLGEKLRKTSES